MLSYIQHPSGGQAGVHGLSSCSIGSTHQFWLLDLYDAMLQLPNTRNVRTQDGEMRRKLLIQWRKMRCISSSGENQQTVPYLDVHNDKLECNTCHHHSSTWTPRRILHMWYLATTLASDGHCQDIVDLLHCRPNERLWNLRIELLRNFQFLNVRRDFLHTDC